MIEAVSMRYSHRDHLTESLLVLQTLHRDGIIIIHV